MDKKLTDSEIVKAWEYCATKGNCSSCFLKAEEYCTNILKRLTIDLFNRLQAENERLKGFATAKCEDCAGCTSWKCDCANIKAEAYKEFAERLKKVYVNFDEKHEQIFYAQLITAIDCLLIGMVGGENGEEG